MFVKYVRTKYQNFVFFNIIETTWGMAVQNN